MKGSPDGIVYDGDKRGLRLGCPHCTAVLYIGIHNIVLHNGHLNTGPIICGVCWRVFRIVGGAIEVRPDG